MRVRVWVGILVALAAGAGPRAGAEEPFFLKGGEKVVFFGDSITQGGHYVTYVEAFLRTRFPDKRFTVVNHGISSETVSGASENDHKPRRPNALDRFERDVLGYKPDVLCACFGMNDGLYSPFDAERFALYQKGIRTLVDGVRGQDGRVVLLTPPPFDPYRRKAGDPDAKEFGYKYPYLNYDEVLARFGQWERSLRSENVTVADVHSLVKSHVAKRRREKVSFFLAGDAVHPNETGHWLMAEAVLLEWNAPAEVDEVVIDARTKEATVGKVEDLEFPKGGLSFSWTSKLPMPISPKWDVESLDLERLSERLNRYGLTVTGLEGGEYQVRASMEDEPLEDLAVVTAKQLADGVDLTSLAAFPTVVASRAVLDRLETRNRQIYQAWRKAIAEGETRPLEARPDEELEEMCQPHVVRVELRRTDSKR